MHMATQPSATRPATLDAALTELRSRGLRASSARRLVLAALVAAERPVPAEAIARGLDGRVPPSDVGSVYRNLDALERIGVIRRLRMGHGAALYTLAGGDDGGYVACERCGEVRTADPRALAAVRSVVHAALGYEVSFTHVPLVGTCAGCARGGGAVR
jgi:Fur family transcriptional regulator, ferric uptake regulator